MKEHDLTPIPQDYQSSVDYILGVYTDSGVNFPNGFQKDAIQNAVGARKTNTWKGWSCDISVVKNNAGKLYVVIEDSGTVGLAGKNLSSDEINKIISNKEKLNNQGVHRYGKTYYKEDASAKKERSKKLLGILNNK